jgi:hypothetical protein
MILLGVTDLGMETALSIRKYTLPLGFMLTFAGLIESTYSNYSDHSRILKNIIFTTSGVNWGNCWAKAN